MRPRRFARPLLISCALHALVWLALAGRGRPPAVLEVVPTSGWVPGEPEVPVDLAVLVPPPHPAARVEATVSMAEDDRRAGAFRVAPPGRPA